MASSSKTLLAAAAMVLVAAAALLPTASSNKTFIVGDDAGWNIGVDYKAWARGKEIKVFDTIVFNPKNKSLDVVLVDEHSFNVCVSAANAVVLSSGGKQAAGKLAEAGKYFFICDAKGACESGLKLAITVQ